MEEELLAQRDAALAVNKELQRKWEEEKEQIESTLERRALTAERMRMHAEAKATEERELRVWEKRLCSRLLFLSLFFGMVGAVSGWAVGMIAFVALAQPFVGFLLILPAMTVGSLLGLVVAKTKIQLENRQWELVQAQRRRHREVEMAVHDSMTETDDPIEAFEELAQPQAWGILGATWRAVQDVAYTVTHQPSSYVDNLLRSKVD